MKTVMTVQAPTKEQAEWVTNKLKERNPNIFEQGHPHSVSPEELAFVFITMWAYAHIQ